MKVIRILGVAAFVVMLVGLVLGTACTGEQGQQGLPGSQGPRMSLSRVWIPWSWIESLNAYVINGSIDEVIGSGFPENTTVEIYLVVAPSNKLLVETVETNGLGCFWSYPKIEGRVQVTPDTDLDELDSGGISVRRPCYLEAIVDGEAVAREPQLLTGPGPDSKADPTNANSECQRAERAIDRIMHACGPTQKLAIIDGNTFPIAWNGSSNVITAGGGTCDAAEYLFGETFQAIYYVAQNGSITNADPGGWTCVEWEPDSFPSGCWNKTC